jgi:ATP-dependent helicase/nuclease subunit A
VALAESMRPTVIAATSLHDAGAPADDVTAIVHRDGGGEESVARASRARAASAVGRAVHAVLQAIDLASVSGPPTGIANGAGSNGIAEPTALAEPAELAELAAEHAAVEGVPERVTDVEAAVRTALSSPTVRRLVAGGRIWREVFVAAPLGESGLIVEGFVDLLGETAEGLVLVDYKTDAVGSAFDLDRWLPGYRRQVAAYSSALERATGRPVVEAVLVFCRGPEVVEVSVSGTALAEAIAEVHARVDRLAET